MALKLRITDHAAVQIRKADAWWSHNRPAASDALHDEFDEALRLLRQQPARRLCTPN